MEGVASRFSCLQDDDSTDWVQPKTKNKNIKTNNVPVNNGKQGTGKAKKKNQANTEAKELQQLAFQTSSKKSKNKTKTKTKDVSNIPNGSSSKEVAQYAVWKEKDEKLVTNTFVNDMEKALLMSKIDFEEQKATQKIIEEERLRLQMLEASKKPKTMSLDQFNLLQPTEINDISCGTTCLPPEVNHNVELNQLSKGKIYKSGLNSGMVNKLPVGNDLVVTDDFFRKLQQDTTKIINQEQSLLSSRNMSVTKNGVALNESALMEQFKATMDLKDKEIAKLQDENETLTAELSKVKYRYKTMRSILDQAEVREKAEIVAEAEKLRKVRDEMSENITQLTEELEQSKTRTHDLSKELRSLQEKRPRKSSHSTSDKN